MLDGMIKTDLNIIKGESGSVLHALKQTDLGFKKFGEVYFSTVVKDDIKAWKLHQNMTLNLVVPVGSVMFGFLDIREISSTCNVTCKIILSQKPYFRLMVPPGIWFGFKGVSSGINLICNIADMPHEPNEIMRKEIDEIEMDWSLE
jgi:dTDP-4-dehydrorhamnose 3,5-epimerase